MKKRWLLLMLSVLLMFTLSQAAFAFPDTKSDPNEASIVALQKAGVLSGDLEGKFNPSGNVTYSTAISMIVKGLGLNLDRFRFIKAPLASDYFTNMNDDTWYAESFVIAHYNGLDIPKDADPAQALTREQFAHLLFQGIEANGEYAYIMLYVMIEDDADIDPAYMNSIQKLVISKIVSLDQQNKFYPKSKFTRSEAAKWLHSAIQFVKKMEETQKPQQSPLTDLKLQIKPVNEKVNEVTVTAQAPHPGYGIRVSSIAFDGKKAVIYTEPVWPDPDKMYPQVITEVRTITYVGSEYEPVLAPSVSVSGSVEAGKSDSSAVTLK